MKKLFKHPKITIAALVTIIVLGVFLFGYWTPRGECVSSISYAQKANGGLYVYKKYGREIEKFKNHSEAMDYCLHVESFLF